ncbi:unnamed protein product, partial [Rotaria magnacalcarata]
IEYDSNLDTFNGFVAPLLEGVPSENAFKCSVFEQLEDLLETNPQANLVNIHVIQPILDSNVNILSAATVLSAYGTDQKITAIDTLKRWLMIYNQFNSKGIRVLGFSTDGDPNFTVKIPSGWTAWFFLSSSQLFLFMQDGAHVCTKIRNEQSSQLAKHLLQANSLTESEILGVDGSTDDDLSNYDEESTDITCNDDIFGNDDLSPTTSLENLQ